MPESNTSSAFKHPENITPSNEIQAGIKHEDDSTTESSDFQYQGFALKDSSESDEELGDSRLTRRKAGELLAFLQQEEAPTASEQDFYRGLQVLKEAHRQRLLETGRLYQQHLLQDSLVSSGNERKTEQRADVEDFFHPSERRTIQSTSGKTSSFREGGLRRSCSLSDLRSQEAGGSRVSPQTKGSQRPVSTSAAGVRSLTVPQPFNMTLRDAQRRSQLLRSRVSQDLEKRLAERREAEEAECQKQFRAAPVPAHVFLPLYQDITEAHERLRKAGLQQRKDFLLSMQRPFSFLQREEKKKEEMKQQLQASSPASQKDDKKPAAKKTIPKAVQDPGVSEHLKEEELYRKIRIQMRAADMLKSSSAPIEIQPQRKDQEKSCGIRTRRKALGFLEEKPSFQPRTNAQAPDFDRLYMAFQRKALKTAEKKDVTRCQPFQLRTSNLPPRHSRKSLEPTQEQGPEREAHVRRRQSFSGILSLSADTLPTYITDAERRRHAAIRNSLEEKKNREKENTEWMKQHRLKSQALKKTVATRARSMDPHKSLKEVYREKLKQHRQTDQQRMREYRKELQEMKTRVQVRPYLFEQVTQKNAKSEAERRYRDTLQEVGLNEQFVRSKGEKAGETPPFLSDEEDAESSTHDTHRRTESVRSSAENQAVEEEENAETK
uniref:FAM161 centrosomal protein B n=1 Tax=Lepisosteus oculatus TaxID=7918 RepID=W5MYQ2_LEPOC|nr:PREDICTED: protein FAM161B [Lepisosteus oculatus]